MGGPTCRVGTAWNGQRRIRGSDTVEWGTTTFEAQVFAQLMDSENSPKRTPLPWAGLIIYLGLALLSTVAVVIADWTDHVALVPIVGVIGAVTGVLLARSLFSGRTAALLATAYGLFITSWLLAGTLDPGLPWRERFLEVWSRFEVFLAIVLTGDQNYDTLMVVFLWCLGYWAMVVFGAWSLFRRGGLWGAVVPLGVALFFNTLYYEGAGRLDLVFATYLLLSVFMFIFQEVRDRQSLWEAMRARVPSHTTSHVVRVSALFALGLVFLAWAGPAFAEHERAASIWTTISSPWRSTRDRLDNMVSGLGSPALLIIDEFGSQLELDAGVEPVDALVMEVEPESQVQGPGRFYWRARSYDTYQSGGWSSSGTEEELFDPADEGLQLPDYEAREKVQVAFEVNNAVQRVLYLPSQPIWVDRPATLRAERADGELVDVRAVLAEQPVNRGETYRALSAIAVPDARQLRKAGEEYPEWVRERYLQLPETVTPRTRELAQGIAGNMATPYDKAQAVTAWLRTNIQYQRVTEAPPPEGEPLDWFLFEYKIGFCNYYATAEVVMLRSVGVPARLAVGYARGDYDAERGVYEVWAEDYHAWPEVYFPGYGWVEFEPTVSQPPLIRPAPPSAAGAEPDDPPSVVGSRGEAEALRLARLEDPFGTDETAADTSRGLAGGPELKLALAAFGFIGLLGLAWTWVDVGWRGKLGTAGGWLSRKTGLNMFERAVRWTDVSSPTAHAYHRWVRWLPRLGLHVDPQQTPYERAMAFERAYPALAEPVWDLVDAYTRERFAASSPQAYEAGRAWQGLVRQLLAAWAGGIGSRLLGWMQEERGAPSDERRTEASEKPQWPWAGGY